MLFNEILEVPSAELGESEQRFMKLHTEIMQNGELAQVGFYNMCKSLYEMKSQKLYEEVGFESFGDYSETAVGLKQSQAYKYAGIYENLPCDFFHSNGKIGVSKLALLASISEEERAEIIEETDLEAVSVKELQDVIKTKTAVIGGLEETIDELKSAGKLAKGNISALSEEIENVKREKAEIEKLKAELESEIKELEATKAQEKEVVETIKEVEVIKEVVIEDEESKKKLAEIEKELKAKEEAIAKLEKELKTADEGMLLFKAKFEDFQKLLAELKIRLEKVPAEKQENCKNAIRKVLEVLGV